MQIQFPRRIQLGFRPFYGLTIRQLIYLGVAAVIAGALILFGPLEGSGLLLRVVVGLAIIAIGVAFAFFRSGGMTIEQWLLARIQFALHPQKRVWTRGGEPSPDDAPVEIELDQTTDAETSRANRPTLSDDADALPPIKLLRPTTVAAEAQNTSAVVVFVDMAVLLALFAFIVYLTRGGLGEIQSWVSAQAGR